MYWTALWTALPNSPSACELEQATSDALVIAQGENPNSHKKAPGDEATSAQVVEVPVGELETVELQEDPKVPIGIKQLKHCSQYCRAKTRTAYDQIMAVKFLAQHELFRNGSNTEDITGLVVAKLDGDCLRAKCSSTMPSTLRLPLWGQVIFGHSNPAPQGIVVKLGFCWGMGLWLVPDPQITCVGWQCLVSNEEMDANMEIKFETYVVSIPIRTPSRCVS